MAKYLRRGAHPSITERIIMRVFPVDRPERSRNNARFAVLFREDGEESARLVGTVPAWRHIEKEAFDG